MKTRRTVNYKAVLVLVVSAALLGVGVHFLHAVQVKRNAHVLLEQADQAETNGQEQEAAALLTQYLGMVPEDSAALARYGLLTDKLAKNPRQRLTAFFVLEKVLRLDGSRAEVRRHLAEMAIDLGRFADARVHLERLQKDLGNNDVELLHLRARCEVREFKYDKAAELYAQAVEKEPSSVEVSLEYASLLRKHLDAPKQADEVMEHLLATAPHSPAAQLGAARYYTVNGSWEQADRAVKVVVDELGSEDVDAFLLAADIANARRNPQQAQGYLERGLKRHPDDSRLSQALARVDLQAGRREEAWDKVKPAAKTLPTEPLELLGLGNLLIDLEKTDEVQEVIKRLVDGKHKWAGDYLRARLRMRQGNWGEALTLLEAARVSQPPAALAQTELLLSTCYEHLGNPDQRLASARAALKDSSSPVARQALASALAALGKTDEAIREYKLLPEQTPETRLALTRLLLQRNLQVAPPARNWDELEQQFKQLPADDLSTHLLKAQMQAAQGKTQAARDLADAERQRDPKQVEPWLFLVGLAEKEQDGKGVMELLEEAEKQAGHRIEWELARAGHWLRTSPDQAVAQLKKLEADLTFFKGDERDRLRRDLGQAFLAAGDRTEAARLWRELAASQPGDLAVRFQLLELAYREERADELEHLLSEVRQLEGGSGALTSYGEAARFLLRARQGNKSALGEARRCVRTLESLRPSWSAGPLLEAESYEIEGRADKALEKYQAALDLGEDRLAVIRRVLQLLGAQGRYAEAQTMLGRLSDRARALGGLDRLGIQFTLLNMQEGTDRERMRRDAVEAARKTIAADSRDYRDHLWLGQMCLLAGQDAESAKAFRRARDVAPDVPDTWAALILLLARTDPKAAEAELAAAKEKLPRKDLPQLLAAGYEALGQSEMAEKEYLNAVAVRSGDPVAVREIARFYVRMAHADKAEPFLRQLLEAKPNVSEADAVWARHTLALRLAFGGNYRQFQEALELVKERADDTPEDRRARALVKATRPEHRREAIRLFENLPSQQYSPDLKFLLAQLYEADDNWSQAQFQLLSLLKDDSKNPVYLAYQVRALLRHKQADEAASWLDQLIQLNGPAVEKMELRARVLHATGHTEEAVKLVKAYAQEKDAKLDTAAQLLESLGADHDAEQLYRDYVRNSKEPASVLPLIVYLGRQDRLTEAMELCEQAWDKCPPELVARAAVALMHNPRATAEQCRLVEQHLAAAASRRPESVLFRLARAEVLDDRGRHDDAVAIYRQVLTREPRNVIARNNLANTLALQGANHDEALKHMEVALEEAGPNAELLDTRAVVYLTGNQPALAIRDLQQAITQAAAPPNTSIWRRLINWPRSIARQKRRTKRRGSWACDPPTCTRWNAARWKG
jgi:tetratricopeptide (TPR) repeat protein